MISAGKYISIGILLFGFDQETHKELDTLSKCDNAYFGEQQNGNVFFSMSHQLQWPSAVSPECTQSQMTRGMLTKENNIPSPKKREAWNPNEKVR